VATSHLRRELRLLVKEPTVTRWVNLCDVQITASLALWQAVRAVDPSFPDHSPLSEADGGEPWDRVPDSFTLARAFRWVRRQRQIEASEQTKHHRPR
jgi:hypothetical protein